jgi:hypothetical protein
MGRWWDSSSDSCDRRSDRWRRFPCFFSVDMSFKRAILDVIRCTS